VSFKNDPAVYDAGSAGYVAMDDDGQWWKWPACEDGWLAKSKCPATTADNLPELPARNSRLALKLSGVEV
jgi:hypothetical protein